MISSANNYETMRDGKATMTRQTRLAAMAAGTAILLMLIPSIAFADEAGSVVSAVERSGAPIVELKVAVVDGIVVLRGKTTSSLAAERATAAVRELGYDRIANLVEVTSLPDDEAIERTAERKLFLSRSLNGCHFRVNCISGTVVLSGTATNSMQIELAQRILQRISGVKSVKANVQI